MADSIASTQEDFDRLVAELEEIKKVLRPAILEDLNNARSNGDLKENADYHAAKEKLQQLDERILFIENRLQRTKIISHDTAAAFHVTFGATVTIKNLSNGKLVSYQLVSSDSVNPAEGRISSDSPIGKALIGAKRGETVVVISPRGPIQYEIIDYK